MIDAFRVFKLRGQEMCVGIDANTEKGWWELV